MIRALAIALLTVIAASAAAQGALRVSGQLEPSSVMLGEATLLHVRIESSGGPPPAPDGPINLPDELALVRSQGGPSNGTTIANGRSLFWKQQAFVLNPQREGTIVIDPLVIQAGGQTLTGDRLVLNVMPPASRQFTQGEWLTGVQSAQPGPISVDMGWRRLSAEQVRALRQTLGRIQQQHAQSFEGNVGFVVTVDDAEPVVGQQVNLSVYLVNGPLPGSRRGIQMDEPQFSAQGGLHPRGGRVHPLHRPQQRRSMGLFAPPFEPLRDSDHSLVNDPHEDRQRFVHLMQQIAFIPLSAGTVEIPPLEATANYLFERPDPLTGGSTQDLNSAVFRTPTLTLEVSPLPDGTQTTGRVTVGRDLRLTTSLSTNEIARDGAAMMLVTLEGEADAASLTAPSLANLASGLRIEPPVNDPQPEQLIRGDRLFSRITWECVVRPEEPGTHVIPSLEHLVYDTGREEFLRLSSEPLTLRVSRRTSERVRVIGGSEGGAPSPRSRREATESAMAPLQLDGFLLDEAPMPLVTDSAWGWTLMLSPLALFAFATVGARRRAVMESEAGETIRLRRRAARHLREAERAKRLGHAERFHSALAAAVYDHLSDTVGTPTQGAPWATIDEALERRSIEPAVRQRIRTCLERTDEARFAPGVDATAAMEADHVDTLDALRDLNRALRGARRAFR